MFNVGTCQGDAVAPQIPCRCRSSTLARDAPTNPLYRCAHRSSPTKYWVGVRAEPVRAMQLMCIVVRSAGTFQQRCAGAGN